MGNLRFFIGSILVTIVGLILSYFVGNYFVGPGSGLKTVFFVFVLGVLEVSLSFDNAVVNAAVLKKMTPAWRQRFITWGMLIAVFGMRILFPLIIVSTVAHISPIEALNLALRTPVEYERIMRSVHTEINAFGGIFLLMVSLKYFFDSAKDVHWIRGIEALLSKFGHIDAIEMAVSMTFLCIMSSYVSEPHRVSFLIYGVSGLIAFIAIDGIGEFLKLDPNSTRSAAKASLGMFLYLEVLDASFSFDGVIGAFALTNNLLLIAIGLGIGAMFVRSLTIMLVEFGTLSRYKYLENGAFWAIGALAVFMIVGIFKTVPEMATGFIGATFIFLAYLSSRSAIEKVEK